METPEDGRLLGRGNCFFNLHILSMRNSGENGPAVTRVPGHPAQLLPLRCCIPKAKDVSCLSTTSLS